MKPMTQSQVEEIVAELSTKCYQTGITVKIVSDPLIGASMNMQTNELEISQWLLEEMSEPQLRGILGHEVGHLALKPITRSDLLPKTWRRRLFLLIIIILIYTLGNMFLRLPHWLLVLSIMLIVILKLIFIIRFKDELNADLISILITRNPKSQLFALEKVECRTLNLIKERTKRFRKILYYILWPLRKQALKELEKRKEQLRKLSSI